MEKETIINHLSALEKKEIIAYLESAWDNMTDKQLRLWVDDAAKAAIAKGQCINQPVMANHIASMALFLAADDSTMCTAQDFIVDGGWA